MEVFNIYYENKLINTTPISTVGVLNVLSREKIIKENSVSKEYEEIPTDKIKIVKCTVI